MLLLPLASLLVYSLKLHNPNWDDCTLVCRARYDTTTIASELVFQPGKSSTTHIAVLFLPVESHRLTVAYNTAYNLTEVWLLVFSIRKQAIKTAKHSSNPKYSYLAAMTEVY